VLTSQGISFLHAGEEFLRAKKGVENSYNKADRHQCGGLAAQGSAIKTSVWQYYRGLIALRKATPELRLASAADIRRRNWPFCPCNSRWWLPSWLRVKDQHFPGDSTTPTGIPIQQVELPEGRWQRGGERGGQAGTRTLCARVRGGPLMDVAAHQFDGADAWSRTRSRE
jgi:hypothetical protein